MATHEDDADPPAAAVDPAALDRLLADGAAAHPGIAAPPGLREFVAARAAAALAAKEPAARAADLYLAAACAAGDAAAIAELDAGLPAIARPALARLGLPPSDDDEIVQRIRVALLAPAGDGGVRIAGYSGRGELRAYLRAVAVRLALKRLEREEAASPDGDDAVLGFLPDAADSPELRLLKQRCRGDVRAAFAAAFVGLEPRARTLLRQHYVDGMTVDALGRLHQVHKATCARWIEAARADVLRGIKRYLRDVLGLGVDELESAIALVRSQLDLSLSRQLPRWRDAKG